MKDYKFTPTVRNIIEHAELLSLEDAKNTNDNNNCYIKLKHLQEAIAAYCSN